MITMMLDHTVAQADALIETLEASRALKFDAHKASRKVDTKDFIDDINDYLLERYGDLDGWVLSIASEDTGKTTLSASNWGYNTLLLFELKVYKLADGEMYTLYETTGGW